MDSKQPLNLIQAIPGFSQHGLGIGAIATHSRLSAKVFYFFAQR